MSNIVLTDERGDVLTPAKAVKPQQANLDTKIYFWHNPKTDHIFQGAPPRFDRMKPPGYLTIECSSANEAERWSKRLADQDRRHAEASDYERELIEGPMRASLRAETKAALADTRNPVAGKLLTQALEQLDRQEAKGKTIRESYLHVEAFEHGK